MRITHLNYSDIRGGAARAGYRLHQGLREAGYDSRMMVLEKSSDDPTVASIKEGMTKYQRRYYTFASLIRNQIMQRRYKRPVYYTEPFSSDKAPLGKRIHELISDTDVVTLHWIAQFVDYAAFFPRISRPLVWRLPDMQALTGGCHYDDGCHKYLIGCGACPQLASLDQNDESHHIWERKRRIFENLHPHQLHFVALCQWMADELKNSPFLNKFPVTIIPNGLDITHTFRRRPKDQARDIFGIPQDARAVLFIADSVINRRKGLGILIQALNKLDDVENLVLLSIGQGTPKELRHIRTISLGPIHHDRILSYAYSAADLFVIPSLQDNLPNTVLESLACGTPVLGFNVGGIPDMVRTGITGELVPVGDAATLAERIRQLLSSPDYLHQLSDQCRRVAESEYSLELQAQRYIELYKHVCSERREANRGFGRVASHILF